MPVYGLLVAGLFLLSAEAFGQEPSIAVIARGNFTTGSELFPESDSPDPVARARSYALDNFLGAGVEVRFLLPETHLALGLSADYLRASNSIRVSGVPATIPAEDGFRVFPVELTGYFLLPLSSPSFGVFMGGGVGVYFGRRVYRIAGVEALPLDHGDGFGIHVLGGVEIHVLGPLSLLCEMKFRDVQFESTTAFPVGQTFFGGVPVTLDRTPQRSTVHVDGVVFQIGTCLSW